MVHPKYVERAQRIRNPRTARVATHRRIDKKAKARYTSLLRVSGVLTIVLAFLMGYVVLTSNLTGLSYAVANAKHERAELQAETMRLDDRISALRSDDRLAALAAKLNMTEPESFAVVRLPLPSNAQPQRLAEFSSLAGLVVPAP
ncbi:MAG: hypothetical protein JO029_02715 [Candidatus Eremiobacteraeota bacterium]|nr:hypothetical protein [Candidatus Eremiobacteraeota bacterium]MBV8283152.1 hypothetical protein [Candidatus Eremiobacteraeota bacterium]MBV8333606.1 hypothetical protein [Candidatus Eremiobacteraeota bacterium]MBV8433173.1 hypothetical protein [Candidatus Eremiobacteraeota bacterium]MBV8654829.1 hypothetical protein [Candidatus Eremiobacteraeota bacterium]